MKMRKCSNLDAAREPFAFITITILSLLVPLSFLLLSKLSGESYSSSFTSWDDDDQVRQARSNGDRIEASSTILRFFCYTNPLIVQALVSVISIAALFNVMTGKCIFIRDDSIGQLSGPRLYVAWIVLITFQICVGLGVEASIESGISSYKIPFRNEIGLQSRVIFFIGLHETMSYWSKAIVKPIVNDTVFGIAMQERVMAKICLAIACGWLWWWRLRDDVESLVVVAELKQKFGMDVGIVDFVSWWVYYVVVMIGLVRVVRSFIWGVMALCCRSILRTDVAASSGRIESDEKV